MSREETSDGPVDDSIYDFFHNVIKPLEDAALWALLRQAVYENYYECEEELSKQYDEGESHGGIDSGIQSLSSSSTHSDENYGTESKAAQDIGRKSAGKKKRSREHIMTRNSADGSQSTSHVCDLCGENIVHKYNLSRHFQLVHKETNWCFCGEDGCSDRFESKEKLQNHKLETHTWCKKCDRRFESFLGLRIHQSERWQCGVQANRSSHENEDAVHDILSNITDFGNEDTTHDSLQGQWSIVASSEKEIFMESWSATLIAAFAHIFSHGLETMTTASMDNIIHNGLLLYKCLRARGVAEKAEGEYRLISDGGTPVNIIINHGVNYSYHLKSANVIDLVSSFGNEHSYGLLQISCSCVVGLWPLLCQR